MLGKLRIGPKLAATKDFPPNAIKIIRIKELEYGLKLFSILIFLEPFYPIILDEASELLEADFPLTLFKQWQSHCSVAGRAVPFIPFTPHPSPSQQQIPSLERI